MGCCLTLLQRIRKNSNNNRKEDNGVSSSAEFTPLCSSDDRGEKMRVKWGDNRRDGREEKGEGRDKVGDGRDEKGEGRGKKGEGRDERREGRDGKGKGKGKMIFKKEKKVRNGCGWKSGGLGKSTGNYYGIEEDTSRQGEIGVAGRDGGKSEASGYRGGVDGGRGVDDVIVVLNSKLDEMVESPEITERDKLHILNTCDRMGKAIQDIGIIMFTGFFERHPESREYFESFRRFTEEELSYTTQLSAHAVRVMGIVQKVAARIHDLDKVAAIVQELGKRHQTTHHAKADYFILLGNQFIRAIQPTLEDEYLWSDEVEQAWTNLFQFLVYHMKVGVRMAMEAGEIIEDNQVTDGERVEDNQVTDGDRIEDNQVSE